MIFPQCIFSSLDLFFIYLNWLVGWCAFSFGLKKWKKLLSYMKNDATRAVNQWHKNKRRVIFSFWGAAIYIMGWLRLHAKMYIHNLFGGRMTTWPWDAKFGGFKFGIRWVELQLKFIYSDTYLKKKWKIISNKWA